MIPSPEETKMKKEVIAGILRYRDDLGQGVRSGVVFSGCPGKCGDLCRPAYMPEKTKMLLTAEELFRKLCEEDRDYLSRRVNVTLLGHDPTLFPDFCLELLALLSGAGYETDVFSCLLGGKETVLSMGKYVHLFTFTVPSLSRVQFRSLTRRDPGKALETLRAADGAGLPYRLRFPVLPGRNDDPESLAIFASFFKSCKSVILDFSRAPFSAEEIAAFRQPFFRRGIVLY